MKKLMFAAIAAFTFAAIAQDAEGPKAEGPSRGPRDRVAMMSRGDMGAGLMGDPALMAVMNPKIAEKIGLSQEVRDQIKKIDQENRDKVRELQAKTRGAMEKQTKLMKAEKIDEAAVMASIDELFDCRKEMAKAQTKRLISIKALLTPEQLAKSFEVMKSMREDRLNKRKPAAEKGAKPECKECDKPADPAPAAK